MKVGIRRIGILLVVAMCAVSIASVATAQETPFVIEGRVFYEGGIPCNAPLVCIENLNTAESGTAETTGTSNYYLLILDSVDLDAGDVLRFNTTKGQHFNISDYTITAEEIEEGGLFDFDITLVSVGAPDLVITNVSEEWINVGNKTYRVRYTVRNIGDAPSQASTTYLYIEDTHIGNDTTGTLVEGENYTSVFESVITGTSLNDTIIVCADGGDLITEGNETNNCLERIVEFVAMPDLRVRTITTPESILYDLSNRINATVDNIGEIDAGTFNVTLEADGNLVDTEVVTALDASFNITVSFAWTPSATGEQTLKVIADTDDQIEESNEYNNELTEGVDVVAMPEPLIVWAYTQDSRHFQDAERLENGNTLISTSLSIIEIDTDGNILWECPDPGFPYDAERLENGNTLIASTSVNRVIEVAPAGTIVWDVGADFPSDAERLDNGNTLIACWGKVIEVAPNKTVVWQYTDVDEAMSAERLDNGNTLIADYPNHHIIEVASNGTIVWAVGATWPTDAERLENGNTLIVEKEWVKELNHDGEIVWKYYTGLYTSPQDVELLENGNTLITYYESPAKVVEIVQPLPGCSRDIFMSNLNMPQDIYAGFANLIKVTVVNVGDTNISDSFDVTLRADGLLIETETIKSIPARSVVMVTFSWTPEEIDEYTFTVTADSDDQIDETDETNNELSRDVLTTIGEPDIIVESISLTTEGFQNEENTISVTVDNIGHRNIETPFNLTVNLDGELLGEVTIDALIGDDKKRVAFSWLPVLTGDYIFTAAIDTNDDITESNETNNDLTKTARIVKKTSWPQFQHDVRHSGFSPSTVPDTDDLLWVSTTCAAGSWCETAPVIADGKVFVYDPDGAMIAFDEATGDVVWRTAVYPATYGSWASPAYHDGNVFIGAGKSTYCIDSDDGSIRWVFTYPSDGGCTVDGGPCIADGKVLAGDWWGQHYYCIDEGTGELLWTFVHEDTGSWGTAYAQGTPAYADGKVYLTFWEYIGGNVYCVNATTGEEIWHWDLATGDTCGSPTVVDGTVYVTTYFTEGADGMIYALYENNGTIKWGHEIIRTDSTPAVAYGNVYISCGCTGYSPLRSYCLNATTGEEVWHADGIGHWTWSPAVADGKVVIGNVTLNAFTGDVLWSIPIEGGTGPSFSSGGASVIADGIVFIVGAENVSAFGSLKPDISVAAIEVPEEICNGTPATVNATIRNDGFVDLDAFNLTLEVDDTIIETEMIDALPADSGMTVSFVWTPQGTGEHTLKVTADPADLIEETCEINNERTKDVTVIEPPHVLAESYGDSILSSAGVYNSTNALHEPDGACAGLSNGDLLSLELEGIVSDSTGVSIWARWAGMQNALMPANFELYVSTNGADWTKIGDGTVYRGDGWQPLQYDYSGNFGDVRYIRVAVNCHPWVGVDLDAVYTEE